MSDFGLCIFAANLNLKEGRIKIGTDYVTDGNINRSPTSYLLNPKEERDK